MNDALVLVTGGSGFVGSHSILQLLNAGYRVRTTVRSLKREPDVREMLKNGGAKSTENLSFVAADLSADAGWPQAVAGCDYVLHVASPFPENAPDHEDDLIVPAREGALRVLRASRDAGVKRVVLTSSFVAIGYGHRDNNRTFTEKDWSDLNGRTISAYGKSKTIAERAAWDFIAREGGTLELAVINPVGILGPALGPDLSTSIKIVKRLLEGSVPAVPKIMMGMVDVRDVAELHIKAMTDPAAKGERFLATAGDFVTFVELARTLKARVGDMGQKIPTKELPNFLMRIFALLDKSVALVLPELGQKKNGSNEKARKLLGWKPRSVGDAVVATAESLIKLGIVNPAKS